MLCALRILSVLVLGAALLVCATSLPALASADSYLGGGGGGVSLDLNNGPGYCGGTTIGAVICNVTESLTEDGVFGLLWGFSYLVGLILGALGIAKILEHVQDPRSVSIWEPIKRFIAGGALFALPTVIEALQETMTGGYSFGQAEGMWNANGAMGGGLDAMLVALMTDIAGPVSNLITAFCYLAGIVLTIIGIKRLLKSAQDGPRGPAGFGTIMTFITAGALFSADAMMGSWAGSLFGYDGEVVHTYAQLGYGVQDGGMDPEAIDHVNTVISAVLAFMMILGWISFIRGWFIIRHVAEGDQQASLMAGLTHLFGGALAVNLGSVMNAVQETFGLSDYGVNFS